MSMIELIYSTHQPRVDEAITGVISLCEMLLPGRIRAYYLTGSYTDGSAVASSDIDLEIVVRGQMGNEREQFERINEALNRLGTFLYDLSFVGEDELSVGHMQDAVPAAQQALRHQHEAL